MENKKAAKSNRKRISVFLILSFSISFVVADIVAVLMGVTPQKSAGGFAYVCYGGMAGILGTIAMTLSLLGRKYWPLVASFVFPTMTVGGFVGTWNYFEYLEGLNKEWFIRVQEATAHENMNLFESLFEWLSYVLKGCLHLGIIFGIVGLIIGSIVFVSTKTIREKKAR